MSKAVARLTATTGRTVPRILRCGRQQPTRPPSMPHTDGLAVLGTAPRLRVVAAARRVVVMGMPPGTSVMIAKRRDARRVGESLQMW